MINKLLYLLTFTCCLYACKKQTPTETTKPKQTINDSNTITIPKDCNQIWNEHQGLQYTSKNSIYEYDNNNRIIKCNDITITYYQEGKLIREVDKAGNITDYEMDENNRVVKQTHKTTVTTYFWDENGFLKSAIVDYGSKQDTTHYINEIINGNIVKQSTKGSQFIYIMTYDLSKPNNLPKHRQHVLEPNRIESYNNKNLVHSKELIYPIQRTEVYNYEFDRYGRIIWLAVTNPSNGSTNRTCSYKYRCNPF